MNFLNPFFLLGLLAVAIPVVLHFIHLRRPQKVSFSSLSFLKELQQSTIRRIRIKQLLLMVLRAAAVLLLALAVARPFLPPSMSGGTGAGEPKTIGILVDNSASMSRIGGSGPLIEQAANIAGTIVEGAESSDRFIIETTNGPLGSAVAVNAGRARELIAQVETENRGNYTFEALDLLYTKIQDIPGREGIVYVITDGQQSQFAGLEEWERERDSDNEQGRVPALQTVILESEPQQNLAITGVELENQMISLGSMVSLSVNVKNVGEAPAANQFVSMVVEGQMEGEYQVNLQPGQEKEFVFELMPESSGDISGKFILEGDEITYDNIHYFVVRIPEFRSVLLVNESERTRPAFSSYLQPALEAARQANTQITFREITRDRVSSSNWNDFDIVILDGLDNVPEYWFEDLQRYVQDGNGILFFPSKQGNIQNYNDFFGLFNAGRFDDVRGEYASFKPVAEVGNLTRGHPVLDHLFEMGDDEEIRFDMPSLYYYYHYRETGNTGAFPIVETSGGEPLLTEQNLGEGNLIISSLGTDPGWSNFPVNPLFAPLFYRTVLYASSSEEGGIAGHRLGSEFNWEGALHSTDANLVLNENESRPEIERIPDGIRLSYSGREWKPGFLHIMSDSLERIIAVNQHIMESEYESLQEGSMNQMLGNSFAVNNMINSENLSPDDLESRLQAAGTGREVWNWFVWGAIFFLIAETVVSKLYRAEKL